MLTQPEFPAHRRREPLRLAELQAYQEFADSDRAGRVLYEVKTSRNVPELDFAALIEGVSIYGAQVKGGQHAITCGQWQRITDDGPVNIPCPMKATWDAPCRSGRPSSAACRISVSAARSLLATITWAGRCNDARDWATTLSIAQRFSWRLSLAHCAVRLRPEALLRTATDTRCANGWLPPTESAVTVTLGNLVLIPQFYR